MIAMRGKSFYALCALTAFAATAFLSLRGMAQDSGIESHSARSRTVQLKPVKQIRADVDLWPLIEHPKDPVERRVNASIVQLNKGLAQALRDCDAGAAEFEKKAGTTGNVNEAVADDWSRRVEVRMRGPRFLSMIATDGFFCGGAHPDDDLTVVVFDLQTGTLVDWASFLAKETGASSTKDVVGYGEGTMPIVLPGLEKIYADAEESYCKDYFEDTRSFLIWLDAKSGNLVAQVAGLPHVAAPCKVDFKMRPDQARKLGFSEEVLSAVEDGHRRAELTGKH